MFPNFLKIIFDRLFSAINFHNSKVFRSCFACSQLLIGILDFSQISVAASIGCFTASDIVTFLSLKLQNKIRKTSLLAGKQLVLRSDFGLPIYQISVALLVVLVFIPTIA